MPDRTLPREILRSTIQQLLRNGEQPQKSSLPSTELTENDHFENWIATHGSKYWFGDWTHRQTWPRPTLSRDREMDGSLIEGYAKHHGWTIEEGLRRASGMNAEFAIERVPAHRECITDEYDGLESVTVKDTHKVFTDRVWE
ncbi:hypothetical protein HK097_010668 [Rhizophlyctis rosea]|uniref:Uncharacterized protein n=1 Tax=Rhizophlyctis rosea TaxID=64517 RepID=A0AAD5X7Z0_9FUNG|nr:hypothetical protein HK097_010668 [Rhizophlyctis rosea]